MRHVHRRKPEFNLDEARFAELNRIAVHRYKSAALPDTSEGHALAKLP
jgi:hypothetical protein